LNESLKMNTKSVNFDYHGGKTEFRFPQKSSTIIQYVSIFLFIIFGQTEFYHNELKTQSLLTAKVIKNDLRS